MDVAPATLTSAASDTLTFELREDGILHVVSLRGTQQDANDAHANIEIAHKLIGDRRVPVLLDIRNTGTLSREARMVYVGKEGIGTADALAMIADSAFSRVVGNIFIRLAKTSYPVKVFSSDKDAEAWLREVRP